MAAAAGTFSTEETSNPLGIVGGIAVDNGSYTGTVVSGLLVEEVEATPIPEESIEAKAPVKKKAKKKAAPKAKAAKKST